MLHLYHDETPPDDEACPICGAPMNASGDCTEEAEHDPDDEW